MPVSKRYLLYAFGFLIILYLLLQYYIHIKVTSRRELKQHEAGTEESNAAYYAVQAFTEVCHKHGLPVFIIDRQLIGALSHNESYGKACSKNCPSWCKYLCGDRQVTSFGITSRLWKSMENVYNAFRFSGFSIATYNQTVSFLSATTNSSASIPVRVLFYHTNGHAVHLVVFHQRGDDEYLWHGQMTLMNDSQMAAAMSESFGLHAGAYDRFDLTKIKLDGQKVRVPKDGLAFLSQMIASSFIECDYQRAQLFYDQFGQQDDSVNAQLFYRAAREILVKAKRVMDSLRVRFWLSSGTCLGWFRQCDLIPYSNDVDLGVWIKDYQEGVIPGLRHSGLTLIHQFGKVEDSFELSFTDDQVKLDIFFFYEEPTYMWNGGTQAKTGKKFKYIFPPFTLCWTEFLRLKVRVPCNTEAYIKANYGDKWFEPVRSWDWKKSPPNVLPNGEWSQEERSRKL